MTADVGPVVLMTDFGTSDPFVGMMKGVIHGIFPEVTVIDLTHGIRPQNIMQGAFVLYRSVSYFPKGSIFCAVVDPGVGTGRRAVAIQTRDHRFVGPDNGLLWAAASSSGIESAVSLENQRFFLDEVSATFHGRDIFAPVSAHLAAGLCPDRLGPRITDPVRLALPGPESAGNGTILTVLDQDIYGNLTLNLKAESFSGFRGGGFVLEFKKTRVIQTHAAYGRAAGDAPFAVPGSHGYIEIAVRNGSAARATGATVGDRWILTERPVCGSAMERT